MLKPGDELAGRYVVGRRIGAGGMGVVYRAEDEKLGRPVAVKVLPASEVGDGAARDRLIREARAAAKLEHPGIVQVFDVGETDDGGAFLVMELVRGKTVRALLGEGAVDRELALRILSDAAATLASAHAEGLVHRDVKPDNIMVRDDGRIVVLDFGLVKSVVTPLTDTKTPDTPTLKQLTESGAIVGTPAYIAPEQMRGRSSAATDQWALAICAYELLTDQFPWEGEDSTFMLVQILQDEPRAASALGDVPPAVDRVLARALAKDPKDRFEGVRAFTDALAAALEGPEEPAGPITYAASVPESVETLPRAAPAADSRSVKPPADGRRGAYVGVAVVVAALVGGTAWFVARDEDQLGAPEPPAAVASPLEDPDAVLGCTVFEAEGVPEPTGWLGAAASYSVCMRANLRRSGAPRTLLAAPQLLGLPAMATEGLQEDPYGAEDARARTLAAAAERSAAWLDGRVRRLEDGSFDLDVRVISPVGVVGEASASGAVLRIAASAAVQQLVESGAIPETPLAPEIVEWFGLEDREALLLFFEATDVVFTHYRVIEWCENALRVLPPAFAVIMATPPCGGYVDMDDSPIEIDRSSPAMLMWTALASTDSTPGIDPSPFAEEIAAARREETNDYGQGRLLYGEGFIRLLGGQPDEAGPLLRGAVERLPLEWMPRVMVSRFERTPEALASWSAAARAWRPDLAENWSYSAPGSTAEERSRRVGHAHLLAPHSARYAVRYAALLRDMDRLEEMRTLAARFRLGPEGELAGLHIEALVWLRQGRFAGADARLQRALSSSTRPFGTLDNGDTAAMGEYLRLADHLGRGREVADQVVRTYLLAEPPPVRTYFPNYEPLLAMACARATPELADEGLVVLQRLRESQNARGRAAGMEALIAGARANAHGDFEAAVAAWRPLVRTRLGPSLLPSTFEAGGASELGRHLDRLHLEDESYGGAHPAQWREALRCEAEGDHDCARRYATRIVDAWSTADVEVPAVAEMQALLARLPADDLP